MTTRFADHLLDGTHASRPAATAVPTGTLYSCSDHSLVYQSDGSAWATWATLGTPGGGGGGGGAAPQQVIRTAGSFAGGASWADVTGMSITVTGVVAGDVHEVGVSGLIGSEMAYGCLDAVTVASSTIQHWLSGATSENSTDGDGGMSGWFGPANAFSSMGCSAFYTVLAGDISSGSVEWRLRFKGSGKTLFAIASHPLHFWVRKVA